MMSLFTQPENDPDDELLGTFNIDDQYVDLPVDSAQDRFEAAPWTLIVPRQCFGMNGRIVPEITRHLESKRASTARQS